MQYSVYDYTRRVYDYYDAPGPSGAHAGSPPVSRSLKPRSVQEEIDAISGRRIKGSVGMPPERASWKLPAGARRTGTGMMPVGRIASLSGADGLSDPAMLALYAIAAVVAWRFLR